MASGVGRSVRYRAMVMAVLASWAAPVAAQYHHNRPPSGRVRCESQSRRYSYCRTNAYGRVVLEKRLSDTPCREDDTWGADRDGAGLWVANGCRGVFVVVPWGPAPGRPPGGPGYRPPGPVRPPLRITCKSEGFKPSYCRLPHWGRVRLEKRLSDTPCREYDTWGVDGGGIWVDRGCAAVFSVQ